MTRFIEIFLPRISSDPLVQCEAALAVLALLAAVFVRRDRWLARVEKLFGALARRRALAIAVSGIAPLVLNILLSPAIPRHTPAVHDEFGYLLQAETFTRGRATNPPHPMWRHFESFHIIQQPTYASMHPVAQGLALATGIRLTGDPMTGVHLSVALMCAALCWMLQGWLPPGWALLGATIAVIRLGTFSHWMTSYWGGAMAAIGGALVLGALGRMRGRVRARQGAVMAIGVAILANSRPYEGLLVAAGCGIALLALHGRRLFQWRFAGAMVLILGATAAMMMFYFWRVTGDPLRMPYMVNRDTYAIAPLFIWQSLKPPPVHRHEVMRKFYIDWEPQFQYAAEQRTVVGYLAAAVVKLRSILAFYVGPAMMLALVAGLLAWRSRRLRPLAIVAAVCLAGSAVQTYLQPHYVAPMVGLGLVFAMQGLRRLRAGPRPALAAVVPAVCVAMLALRAAAGAYGLAGGPEWPLSWSMNSPANDGRASILDRLKRSGGKHLVIVQYSPSHDILSNEWVYNEPDIDAAPVVWAREMDVKETLELMRYFSDRTVSAIEPGSGRNFIVPRRR